MRPFGTRLRRGLSTGSGSPGRRASTRSNFRLPHPGQGREEMGSEGELLGEQWHRGGEGVGRCAKGAWKRRGLRVVVLCVRYRTCHVVIGHKTVKMELERFRSGGR